MAMPALKYPTESPVEERVAVLEANIEHIRSDISEMKTDIRRLNEKIDGVDQKLTARIDRVEEKLTARIDRLEEKLTAKIDGVKDGLANLALSMEKAFSSLKVARVLDRVWWLLMSAALLGVMARGFKWI
jgi:chromosome segregation ATPase